MEESMSVQESDAVWLSSHSDVTKSHGGDYLLFDAKNMEQPLPSTTTTKDYNMTFKFAKGETKLIRMMMVAHGISEVSRTSTNFNICWGAFHFQDYEYKQLKEGQKINYFPGSAELTQKDHVYKNFKQMQIEYEEKGFNFMPISFLLPRDYKLLCDTHTEDPSTWIVKPVDEAQGRGIYLADQMDQVSPDAIQLVSKYLDSPLLINGYKFDLRLYVVVTSLDPLVIYLYEDGLVRLAAEKYQIDEELWNHSMHLTNSYVRKFNSKYANNEESGQDNHGHLWSLSAFLEHLKSQNVDTVTVMRNVENAVTGTVLAASENMKTASENLLKYPNTCFELYGFDILIDSELKAWVLEVNLNPGLNINTPINMTIKSALIADLLTLVGIKICDPNSTNKYQSYCKQHNLNDLLPTSYHSSCINDCAAEEYRLVHQVCDEYKRRGGWNRIFPDEDSWNLYNGIREYETPLNLILHKHLYPQLPLKSTRLTADISFRLVDSEFLQRMACYEQSLSCGLNDRCIHKNKRTNIIHEKQMDFEELLDIKVDELKATGNKLLLSKYCTRLSIRLFLKNIHHKLLDGLANEEAVGVVSRFLKVSGKMLQKSFYFHSLETPYAGIPVKSRATILSKYIGDFITLFNKETFGMLKEDLNNAQNIQCSDSNLLHHETAELHTSSQKYFSNIFLYHL